MILKTNYIGRVYLEKVRLNKVNIFMKEKQKKKKKIDTIMNDIDHS